MECKSTGLVYRNPNSYLRAIHAWHPSVVALGGEDLLATFDLGQAVESFDYATYVSRSSDGGETWDPPRRLFEDPQDDPCTHTMRVSLTREGRLVGFGVRLHRNPDEGITNRSTHGFVPTDLIHIWSDDRGVTWHGPQEIEPPLVGPGFEICHSIVELDDGRWLAPTATWRGWNGEAPNGTKAVALVSHDRGATWPEFIDVIDGTASGVVHWEQSLVQLQDGRLLAVAWALHVESGKTRPTPYVISGDLSDDLSKEGVSFSEPRPTGLLGQTAKLLCLPDGRILCVYRRNDRPGLWGNVSRLEGERWVNLEEAPLWQGAPSGMAGVENAVDELSALKFGYPNLQLLPDGDVFVAFWCCEDCIYSIRWLRLRV